VEAMAPWLALAGRTLYFAGEPSFGVGLCLLFSMPSCRPFLCGHVGSSTRYRQ
jgi:hypothetical protein